ncbi:MAG: hypothetical protein JSU81_09495 [Candidatus Coatesbacteria bacterium]|nr:MAG: hypothetical protein JSU81_09495 [Candidatus Coatesbacteria bacterium]
MGKTVIYCGLLAFAGAAFFMGEGASSKLTATKHNYKPILEDNVVVGGD